LLKRLLDRPSLSNNAIMHFLPVKAVVFGRGFERFESTLVDDDPTPGKLWSRLDLGCLFRPSTSTDGPAG
jgi:hypothetical protein